MKTKNTYSLLMDSEEKNRNLFESAVYILVVASMAFAVFAFASQSIVLPGMQKAEQLEAPDVIAKTPVVQPSIASRG